MSVLQGSCNEILPALPADFFDCIVTDPPYGIGQWDWIEEGDRQKGQVTPLAQQKWHEAWGKEALRVLKPGGHAFVFGGSRTAHRIGVGLEDAGFEIRDGFAWIYTSGQVKAARMAPPFEQMRYQLKPGVEPIWCARKPLSEKTLKANLERWGTGALNVVETAVHDKYPTNVLVEEGTDEDLKLAKHFFLCPKPSKKEREAGLDDYEPMITAHQREEQNPTVAMGFGVAKKNHHPTVKPMGVMQWLIRLGTPHGGHVLDPFVGSGTTVCAAALEGRWATGIELDEEHAKISELREAYWAAEAIAQQFR